LCCLLEGSTYRFEGFVLLRHHALVEDVDLLKGSVVHPEEHACNELCHHPPHAGEVRRRQGVISELRYKPDDDAHGEQSETRHGDPLTEKEGRFSLLSRLLNVLLDRGVIDQKDVLERSSWLARSSLS
jgi:hypothetical protein